MKDKNIQLFEDKQIRTAWDEANEEWYVSIVDVVEVLTEQFNHQGARNYWKVLKKRLKDEGNETVTNCNRLKMTAEDGKMRFTDVANTEQLLRIIQSIPSPKAEPFKILSRYRDKIFYSEKNIIPISANRNRQIPHFERSLPVFYRNNTILNHIRF